MGAKDWMLLYADGAIRPILRAAPAIDRDATRALVRRLYPAHRLAEIADGTLFEQANPAEDQIYVGCFPGLAVVCTSEAALDRPSQLSPRFLDETAGPTVYLHTMHSVLESGLGTPADIDALNQKIIHLEQQVIDLRLQLEEQGEDLAAARATNRELMTQLNTTAKQGGNPLALPDRSRPPTWN